ncbi:ferredoxin [Actinomadura sp. NTSP31]|uniref:ferredoxin n=1 Tax=Actinomadura sp. NTSP31 TaxID=1735447 RepID=UPI0035C22A99
MSGGTAGAGRAGERPEVAVTPRTCAGTGVCAFYAPGTFELDGKGTVRLRAERGEDSAADSAEDVRNAAEACPTGSIRLSFPVER